jgi:hypothetical protein
MPGMMKDSVSHAVIGAINIALGGLRRGYPNVSGNDGWQDTNRTIVIPPKDRMACALRINDALSGLGVPATEMTWTPTDIAFPQVGSGMVADLVDYCFRSIISAAIRRALQKWLGLAEVPAEAYAWQKAVQGVTLTPAVRTACDRAIREGLQLTGFSELQTDRLETTKMASPGDDPGDVSNLVDYCCGVLSKSG